MGHQTNLRPRFKKLPATGGPTVTFPRSPSPQLPRAAPPPPPPSAGPGRARGAGSAAAASDPSSRGRGGRAQTGSEEGIRGAGVTWGPSPPGDLGEEDGARRPSQRGCGNVGSGQFPSCLRPATGAARTADEDKAPDSRPLRPQPRGPLRSVTRTARADSGFHWWASRPRLRPPPTAAPLLSPSPRARGSGARAPGRPRGGAGPLGSRRSGLRLRRLAFRFSPSDATCGRCGAGTTPCENGKAPRGAARRGRDPRLFSRLAGAASKAEHRCSWNRRPSRNKVEALVRSVPRRALLCQLRATVRVLQRVRTA